MSRFFSDDGMVDFGDAWNDGKELGDGLAKIGFSSVSGSRGRLTRPRGLPRTLVAIERLQTADRTSLERSRRRKGVWICWRG